MTDTEARRFAWRVGLGVVLGVYLALAVLLLAAI